MNSLNEAQQRAVLADCQTIAIVASPGSGKSSTLIARIAYRVAVAGTDPRGIVCLTFTNAGAKVMADKLAARGITVGYCGTRHGLMYRLINRYGTHLGFRAGGVNIATEEEMKAFVPQVAIEQGYRGTIKALNARADNASRAVWTEIEHRLKRNNTLSHDTTLAYGLKLLQDPDVCSYLEVDELLCDEAQDNSEIDWRIDALIPAKIKCAVGDLDQSVFGFRGAWPAGFLQYATDAQECITMELNYRSGRQICSAASDLIEHNTQRLPKQVISATGHEDSVTMTPYSDDRIERQGVARLITLALNTVPANEIAVLCRRNDLCDLFRQQLRANNIPLSGDGEKPPLPPDWSYGLDVLRLLHDPRNDIIAERVLSRTESSDRVAKFKAEAVKQGVWLSHFMASHLSGIECAVEALAIHGCSRETQLLVKERLDLLPQTKPALSDLIHDLFNHIDWVPRVDATGVHVGTIHSGKGHEWDVVFLPAFEEGTIPTLRKDSTPATLEEERRTAFVAITRARRLLHISWARKRWMWGKPIDQQPSRFITEAMP